MANQDNPNPIQVEDLAKFCGRHKHVFIYGCCEPQVLLEKFLRSADITVDGFLVDFPNQVIESTRPVYTLEEAQKLVAYAKLFHRHKKVHNDTCVIISNEDYMCNWTYNQLKNTVLTKCIL